VAPPGPREGEEQGAGAAPERDQRSERKRPGPADEEFGERGAPADQDGRYQRTEDGAPVVRESGSALYGGGFARVQKRGLREFEDLKEGRDDRSP